MNSSKDYFHNYFNNIITVFLQYQMDLTDQVFIR
jgi:hypothetical protein